MSKIVITLALVLSLIGCVAGQSTQIKQMDIVVLGGAPTLPAAGLDRVYSDSAGFHCLTSAGTSCFTSYNLALQTNGVLNTSQSVINLIAGTNVTLVNGSGGNVTISATGGGGGSAIFQTNGVGIISSSTINFLDSTNIKWTNPSNGNLTASLLFPALVGDVTNTLGSFSVQLIATGIPAGACVKPTFDTKGRGTSCNNKITGTSDINGPILSSNMPAFTGDATSLVGTSALTLAATGVSAGACVKPTVDAKGRTISCSSQIAAATDINGQLVAANIPAYGGDINSAGGTLSLTVSKINGTSVPVNSAANQVLITTSSTVGAWKTIPDCQDGAGHLNYTVSTNSFSCGIAGGGGGGGNTTSSGLVTGNLPVATGTTVLADSGIAANKVAKINASNTWNGTLNNFTATEVTVANPVNPTDVVNLQTMQANGTVTTCSTINSFAYYSATGNDVSCDTRLTDSGGVNPTLTFVGTIVGSQLSTSGAGAGQEDFQCGASQTSAGTGYVSLASPANCVNGLRFFLPGAVGTDGQVVIQASHSGTDSNLVLGTVGIAGGGTGQTTQLAAFTALAPTGSGVGSVIYLGPGGWTTLAGNNGAVNCLQESISGVPSWGTCGGGGGGGTFSVNGSLVSNPNLNNTTPVPGTNMVNAQLQVSGSSVSLQVPDPSKVANLPADIVGTPCAIYSDGTGTSGALQASDNRVARCKNDFPATLTVTKVSCWGDATDSLTVQVAVAVNGISGGTNLLSSACVPGNRSWNNCSLNGTPTIANNSSLYTTITVGGSSLTKAYCQVYATRP